MTWQEDEILENKNFIERLENYEGDEDIECFIINSWCDVDFDTCPEEEIELDPYFINCCKDIMFGDK